MSDVEATADARIALAERFLQEAVFRSRELQSRSSGLSTGELGAGDCGLGGGAVVELELSPRGRELAAELWPTGLDADATRAAREVMEEWVRRQDALDRKRNHFMKAFRQEHGFDRAAYSPELATEYEAGLAAVNAEVDAGRGRAAAELLERA